MVESLQGLAREDTVELVHDMQLVDQSIHEIQFVDQSIKLIWNAIDLLTHSVVIFLSHCDYMSLVNDVTNCFLP